uniref:Uncharacterized protein n=1 Tax=Ixodes ricinus TaxID=34613 RepID=A0A147BB62_IXORI
MCETLVVLIFFYTTPLGRANGKLGCLAFGASSPSSVLFRSVFRFLFIASGSFGFPSLPVWSSSPQYCVSHRCRRCFVRFECVAALCCLSAIFVFGCSDCLGAPYEQGLSVQFGHRL